jgi:hypothetical protein
MNVPLVLVLQTAHVAFGPSRSFKAAKNASYSFSRSVVHRSRRKISCCRRRLENPVGHYPVQTVLDNLPERDSNGSFAFRDTVVLSCRNIVRRHRNGTEVQSPLGSNMVRRYRNTQG